MKRSLPKIIIPFLVVALVSCGSSKNKPFRQVYNSADSCKNVNFKYDEFEIKSLSLDERFYVTARTELALPTHTDDDNIVLHQYLGKFDYHPVAMATYAIELLDVFSRTKDTSLLELSIKHANKLIGISMPLDSTILFPYSFYYEFFDVDKMKPPWFSAMAQGKALSLFSRLYEITQELEYKEIADKIFKSFYRFKKGHDIWVSCVDEKQNLWLEEYPHEQPSHVLNGMIFAIYGIYDYYMINPTDESAILLKATITTIKDNIDSYRLENNISYYCMKYDVQNPYYHPIHIDQLLMLHKISGIQKFYDVAMIFTKDGENAPPPEK